jgi:hypothetical protein
MHKNELSLTESKIIADKVMKDIFEPDLSYKTTIFLCGKDVADQSSIRYKISYILNNAFLYAGDYEIIYPEDIFEALLYKSSSDDLLSLENLLADSVDVVVVIPESAGSIAELGAFANNEKLRNKMVCVLDKKYERDKSFINQGPVKLIKRGNNKAIVHINPALLDESLKLPVGLKSFTRNPELDKVVASIRNVKKGAVKTGKKLTLLGVDRFLLPIIYLLEPVGKKSLTYLTAIVTDDEPHASSITETALSILVKKRWVQSSTEGFSLTDTGVAAFLNYRSRKGTKITDKTKAIDDLRLEILNLKYRNKKLRVT